MVYFVATPIGNLKEITQRAIDVLSSVEAIFCEDTRHSRILLDEYGISKSLYSYHKFNEKQSLDFVLLPSKHRYRRHLRCGHAGHQRSGQRFGQ